MTVPEGIASITPEWLTDALGVGGAGHDVTVKSFRVERVGEEEGWIGKLALIELSYSGSVEDAPSSVVVKFSPPDPGLVFSRHEVPFYHEIAAGHDLDVPTCYYGATDPETGGSVMLLEDLCRLRKVRFVDACTLDEVEAAVRALAKLHTVWWNDAALETKNWLLSIADTKFIEWWAQYPRKIRSILPDFEVSSGLMEFGDRFAADMPLVVNRIEGAPFTAIHRDIHVDNLLFGSRPDDPPVVLIDWQTAGRGKGISDIAYLLITSLSPQDRRRSERRLVEVYHRLLIEAGIEDYPFDQCWSDYVVSFASKLFITVTATVCLENTTPHHKAWRRADLQRLMAFVDDHDPLSHL